MDCNICKSEMEEMVLRATAASADAESHLAECEPCRTELKELRATMALMDAWTAPEPSAWFDTKMIARLRAEQAAEPEGFWERMKARLLFNTGAQFRPMMAGALALLLIMGGAGTYLGTVSHDQGDRNAATISATVNDLQIIDRNDQALQEMDVLLDEGQSQTDEGIPQS